MKDRQTYTGRRNDRLRGSFAKNPPFLVDKNFLLDFVDLPIIILPLSLCFVFLCPNPQPFCLPAFFEWRQMWGKKIQFDYGITLFLMPYFAISFFLFLCRFCSLCLSPFPFLSLFVYSFLPPSLPLKLTGFLLPLIPLSNAGTLPKAPRGPPRGSLGAL